MPSHIENWHQNLPLIVLSGLIYSLSFVASSYLNTWFEFSHSTSWIYLPSGVRLLLVLIMFESGAVGILLGTLAIDYLLHNPDEHLYNWITATIAGGSAYLSLKAAQRLLRLDPVLSRLKQIDLLQVCIIFSVVSPLMHQLWYFYNGLTENFWHSFAVMALGDLGGSILILGAIIWIQKLFRMLQSP